MWRSYTAVNSVVCEREIKVSSSTYSGLPSSSEWVTLTVIRHVPYVKRRHLQTLRDRANNCIWVVIQSSHACLNHIDLWRTSRFAGTWVVLACAGAGRQAHPREVTDAISRTLVWCDARITFIMITVRPHSFCGRSVSRPRQIPHRPETGPKSRHITGTRQGYACLQATPGEAQLVPALYHPWSVFQLVIGERIETNLQDPISSRYRIWVVPLQRCQCLLQFAIHVSWLTSKSCVTPYQRSTAW